MCGIVGFFGKKETRGLETLQSMIESLVHRGPDAKGHFLEVIDGCQVGLGHTRLSIMDISSNANQPMMFENLILVYNGEVYNFAEIKRELLQEGYAFHTEGDTEVVLKAFHRWGITSINKFRGMFSFCIFDKLTKKAFLVRDRAGVKPLCFYHDEFSFIFSSEIKSLSHHPRFKQTLSEQGVNLYFQYGYIPAPHSIFSGVQKVRPGHYIEYDAKENTFSEKKYWDLSFFYHLPKLLINEQEATEQLHNLLSDAFSLRLISDVPVGVFLSGGIDSSLIASILQTKSNIPINTFTIGFNDHYDESTYAKKIAQHLGTDHHERIYTWKEVRAVISQIPSIFDEPFADSSCIPTALIAQFARQKVTVALSGDGGDELFCGYISYLLNSKRFARLDQIPFRKALAKLLDCTPDPVMSFYRLNYDFYNRYLKLKSIFRSHHVEDKYQAIIRTFTSYDVKKLLSTPQLTLLNNKVSQLSAIEKMMLMDFNYYLPNDLMVKVDRATMYHSLEGREPLLDHKILEFAAQLPMPLKNGKNILKKILAKYLPVELYDRRKFGFGVPINHWLKNDLSYLLKKYLDKTKIKKQGIFNEKYITALCNSFTKSKTNDNRIWTLLVFQMWYETTFNDVF